jgi:hypothetical protein
MLSTCQSSPPWLTFIEVHREQDNNSDSDVQSGQVNFQLCDENDSQENSLFSYFDISNHQVIYSNKFHISGTYII